MTESDVPDVSVVVAVYDAMPYLLRCLESVEAQSIGADRIELIAVDDGSTDGSAKELDRFAERSPVPVRVIHQENSGGASRPRNVGIELARGRYVFFLDADDYLGEEALERMIAMGDRNGTDVVLGKMVGVGRGVPKSMWYRSVDRTDVYSSNVKFSLSAQKLFRRSLLDEHGIRFREDLKTGEDVSFTMEAYLRAGGLSIVADYPCYYLVAREDGNHLTKTGNYRLAFASARALIELIGEMVPPGPRRDDLMVRPFAVNLTPQFGPVLLKQDEEVRRHKLEMARPLLDEYWTDGVASRLRVHERLRLHCVQQGRMDQLLKVAEFIRAKKQAPLVVDVRRHKAYLAYPLFRERGAGIPDEVFDAAGEVPENLLLWRSERRRLPRTRRTLRKALGPRLSRTVARGLQAVRERLPSA